MGEVIYKRKISLALAAKFIARLEKAGLTDKLMEEICACPDNHLAEEMMLAIKVYHREFLIRQEASELESLRRDKCFKKIIEFPVRVSAWPSINEFRKTYSAEFTEFDKNLKDENFCPSTNFVVGEEKIAVVYRLLFAPSSNACLKFIRAHRGQFPNLQGLALAYEQWKGVIPEDLCFIGFDEKENLWTDRFGQKTVSVLWPNNKGEKKFNIVILKKQWGRQDCLLFFLPSNGKT